MGAEYQSCCDEDLARKSQEGELAAFEELARRYERRIYSFLRQSGGSDADACEVTQETFVRAFSAIAQFDPRRSFASWLFGIARRKSIDAFRARIPGIGEPAPEPLDENDPGEALARTDEARFLWGRARALLAPAQFQSLWLRYAEDMNIAEIAAVMGKTQTYVKVLLFRARRQMAAEFDTHGFRPRPATATLPATARGGNS